MQPTDGDIKEFQSLWREEFNEEIQFEVARIRASELLELYAQLVQAPWIESEASTRSSPKQSHHS